MPFLPRILYKLQSRSSDQSHMRGSLNSIRLHMGAGICLCRSSCRIRSCIHMAVLECTSGWGEEHCWLVCTTVERGDFLYKKCPGIFHRPRNTLLISLTQCTVLLLVYSKVAVLHYHSYDKITEHWECIQIRKHREKQ